VSSSPGRAPQPQIDSVRSFFQANGAPAGSVDILAVPEAHPWAQVGELCAALRFMSVESRCVFDRVVVARPPADHASAEAVASSRLRLWVVTDLKPTLLQFFSGVGLRCLTDDDLSVKEMKGALSVLRVSRIMCDYHNRRAVAM
jgi:hypothetical protein